MDAEHRTPSQEGEDIRPDFWAKPEGNWAKMEFNGLNIHHTNEKNWARGASMHLSDCHFSDNSRSWLHKAGANPTAGANKSVTNTTFVGFTRNTGHKICTWDLTRDYTSHDLLQVRQCADNREGPVDLIDQPPMTDVFERRQMFWFKPHGEVYRLMGQDQWYPWQAMSIYDSFVPTLISNVTFFDYPAKEGEARRHALGAHFNHKFVLIPKQFALQDVKERFFFDLTLCVFSGQSASLTFLFVYPIKRHQNNFQLFTPKFYTQNFNTQANKSKKLF